MTAAERLQAWRDGVDAAIARTRATEGFDGTHRGWQTLGECLLPEPPPTPRQIAGRLVVRCARCQISRFYGEHCRTCAAGLATRRAS